MDKRQAMAGEMTTHIPHFQIGAADWQLRSSQGSALYHGPLTTQSLALRGSDAEGIAGISLDGTELRADDGKTISLIGGDIQIKGSHIIGV